MYTELHAKLIEFRTNIINDINNILLDRNHERIQLDETLSNNWIDKINNEQIFSYERESGMLGVECMGDTYNIYIESVKIETLVDLLGMVENQIYKVENDEE